MDAAFAQAPAQADNRLLATTQPNTAPSPEQNNMMDASMSMTDDVAPNPGFALHESYTTTDHSSVPRDAYFNVFHRNSGTLTGGPRSAQGDKSGVPAAPQDTIATMEDENMLTDVGFGQLVGNLHEDEERFTAEVTGIYHQNPTPLSQLSDTSNLWRFPTPHLQEVERHKMHPIGALFYKTGSTIKNYWDIEPSEVVPEVMRKQTPYSLALFLGIRRVSSHTKQQPEVGQNALISVWRARTGRQAGLAFDKNGMQPLTTTVSDHLVNPDRVETVVQETNYGLTLEDVAAAIKIGRDLVKVRGPREAPPQPAGKLRGKASTMQRAEKRAARNEKKRQNQAAKDAVMAERQKNVTEVADSRKIAMKAKRKEKWRENKMTLAGGKGYKLLRLLEDDDDGGVSVDGYDAAVAVTPPNSPAAKGTHSDAYVPLSSGPNERITSNNGPLLDLDPATNPTPADSNPNKVAKVSKLDRHNDRLLSQLFNRVDMDSIKTPGGKKAKKLLAGGTAAAKGALPMPTERVKLAEIPTLYAQQSSRQVMESLEGFTKMKVTGAEMLDGGEDVGGGVALVKEEEDEEEEL